MHRQGPLGQFISLCLISLMLVQYVPITAHVSGPCPLEDCDCEEGICRCDHWMNRQATGHAGHTDRPVLAPCGSDLENGAIVFTVERTLLPDGSVAGIRSAPVARTDRSISLTAQRVGSDLLRPPRG